MEWAATIADWATAADCCTTAQAIVDWATVHFSSNGNYIVSTNRLYSPSSLSVIMLSLTKYLLTPSLPLLAVVWDACADCMALVLLKLKCAK